MQEAGLQPRKGAEVHAVYRQVPSSPSCSLGSARLGLTLSAMHKLKASGEARPPTVHTHLIWSASASELDCTWARSRDSLWRSCSLIWVSSSSVALCSCSFRELQSKGKFAGGTTGLPLSTPNPWLSASKSLEPACEASYVLRTSLTSASGSCCL